MSSTLGRWLGRLAAVFVAAGVVLQAILIVLLLEYAYTPHSESRASQGLGLMAITLGVAVIAVPSTVVAILNALGAIGRQRREGGALGACAFYIVSALLPVVVWYALDYPDPYARRDNPTWLDRQFANRVQPGLLGTRGYQKEMSGRSYAINANLFDVAKCAHASPEFTHGCRDEVHKRFAKRPPAGEQKGAPAAPEGTRQVPPKPGS
jgi:hypothetical protein